MASHNRKGRSKDTKRSWESCWVELHNGFRQERAWKALTPAARVIYCEIKSLYNGSNNGRIMASERHLSDLSGLAKNTVSRALGELQGAGFIVEMRRGCLGIDGKGKGSLWRLTELGWAGERPSQDYKKNRTPDQKLTQGGSRTDPGKRKSGSRTDPGWVKNCPREGAKNGGSLGQELIRSIDLPEGGHVPDLSTTTAGLGLCPLLAEAAA